jgi:GcrA cell cycle regulator
MTFLDQKRNDLQTWTDERVELLKKLWGDGLSASQIAGELGGITRNAVIGKVHRLGLSGRAKAPSSSMPRPRKPRPATQDVPCAAAPDDARQHSARRNALV